MQFNPASPIYLQVIDDIKKKIVRKELVAGDKLMSTRDLAIAYKINPNTASRVYSELEAQGITYTKRGMGTYVSDNKDTLLRLQKEMAQEIIQTYKTNMMALGFSQQELIDMLREEENHA